VIRLVPERGGWLEVVCGPMFSGKSEELIRRLRRAEIAGQRALIVKPRLDNRYDIGHVVSHAGARMRAVAVDNPADIPGLVEGYDVVGVDEVQFFRPEIVLVLDGLVEHGCASSRAGSTRTSAASRSARCPSSCAAPSSSTSSRRSATAAVARPR
jgi:Thymidine kinase